MFRPNTKKLLIKTPMGWEPFKGILEGNEKEGFIFYTKNNRSITVSKSQPLKTNNGFQLACDIQVGDFLYDESFQSDEIISKVEKPLDKVYDIIETTTHTVVVNGFIGHQCDEFAHVKPSIQGKFWTSINPTLSTGGRCLIASTPNGDSDLFADLWFNALVQEKEGTLSPEKRDFVPYFVKWDEVPGRDEEFKRQEIAKMGLVRFEQEYQCKFISSENLLIDPLVLEDLNKDICTPTYTSQRHKIQFWDTFKPNRLYIVGVDPSAGTGADYSVIQIFEFPQMQQIAMYRTNTMASPELYVVLKDVLNAIELVGAKALFSIENNGVGEGIISLYNADEKRPNAEFVSESFKRKGFVTTNRSKLSACLLFKDMVENRAIKIKSPRTLSEMKNFIRKGAGYQAQSGATDDCISAILIVLRILEHMSSYDQIAYNKIFIDRPQKARQSISLTSGNVDDIAKHPLT